MTKKDLRLPAAVLFGIYMLYSLVLTPLYQFIIADAVLTATLWLDLIDLLCWHTEIIGSILLYAFLVVFIYRHGLGGAKPMIKLAVGAIVFKYLLAIITASVLNGSLDLTGSLNGTLFAFLLELCLAALCVYLCSRLILPALQAHRGRAKAAKTLNVTAEKEDGCYPFRSFFSFKNPLQRTLFWSILLVTVWHLASFVMGQLLYGFDLSVTDVLVLTVYAIVLILLPAFLGYVLSLLLIKRVARESSDAK